MQAILRWGHPLFKTTRWQQSIIVLTEDCMDTSHFLLTSVQTDVYKIENICIQSEIYHLHFLEND